MKSVRANLPLSFFTFMVCHNQKRKKGRTGKEKRKLMWEGDAIVFLCGIMNSFIERDIEEVRVLGGVEGVC